MAAAVQPVRDSQQPDTTQSGDDLITHGFAEPKVPPLQITQTHQSSSSQPTDNEKTTHPWKYVGYKDYSKWVASDQAFLIVRRFSTLNARVMLALQDDVLQLEERLKKLDKMYSSSNEIMQDEHKTDNGTFRREPFHDRGKLIREDLTDALSKYNSFVNDYAQLATRPQVHPYDMKAVRDWHGNYYGAINDEEAAYITDDRYTDDLIPVHPKSRSWFRRVLERSLLKMPRVQSLFCRTPSDPQDIDDGLTLWQNDKRMERLSFIFIGFAGLAMLIGPLWWLNYLQNSEARLGVITGFVTAFFVIVAKATTASVYETLAAAAAYSAVLMVFMQSGPGNGSGNSI